MPRLSRLLKALTRPIPTDISEKGLEALILEAADETRLNESGEVALSSAAQARRRNALLVTVNEHEFARVPGLQTEDWAAG